jgi:hypothetical protein
VSGFHFNEDRTIGVAFRYDVWFEAGGSENAVEVSAIIIATEAEDWFGRQSFQRDGFQLSKGMRSVQRDTQRVSVQRFELDACDPLAGRQEQDGEFERGTSQPGDEFIESELMQQYFDPWLSFLKRGERLRQYSDYGGNPIADV